MHIKKLGHCCLIIDTNGKRVLTDPGAWTVDAVSAVTSIDLILITHEHADHVHIESLRSIMQNNPQAHVVTNTTVGALLREKSIAHTILEGESSDTVASVSLRAHDCAHEEIFGALGRVQNTGYMIGDALYYPGDAFSAPDVPVDVLALPVAGPWCRIRDAISFALSVHPRVAFPVHDGMIQEDKIGGAHAAPQKILAENGITFVSLKAGDEITL